MNSKCGVQSKRRCESHESCVCIAGFPACGCQKKSVLYETECRHAAVQRGKQDQNHDIFIHYRLCVCLLLEKVIYPETVDRFCVVLLKSAFFLTKCLKQNEAQVKKAFHLRLILFHTVIFCLFGFYFRTLAVSFVSDVFSSVQNLSR